MMKKSLALVALLGFFATSSQAATVDLTQIGTTLTAAQTNFRALSEDFGAALSYKPITPSAALGLTGFDIGIELSATDMANSAAAWRAATGGDALGTIIVPRLHVAKGLPFGIDISAFMTSVPGTDIRVTGGALSYAILEGGLIEPALTVRGAVTNLTGITDFTFSTRSLDISVSKGFLGFTPYIGTGIVWVNSSTAAKILGQSLADETFSQSKVYAGLNFNLGLPNFAFEADQTGGVSTVSAKIGLRW